MYFVRVQGRGVGVANVRDGSTAWLAPGVGIFSELPMSRRASFRISANAQVPLARPTAYLDDLGTVQRPAPLTGDIQFGVILRFQ
jgi:hypothetical protein